jgi:hypothetical protein
MGASAGTSGGVTPLGPPSLLTPGPAHSSSGTHGSIGHYLPIVTPSPAASPASQRKRPGGSGDSAPGRAQLAGNSEPIPALDGLIGLILVATAAAAAWFWLGKSKRRRGRQC